MELIEDWGIAVAGLGPDGGDFRREATEVDRSAVARQLDLVACKRLVLTASIVPLAKGRYRATGRVSGVVVQSCVVSLDPVESEVSEDFDVEFWPEDQIPDAGETERGVLEGAEIEPLSSGIIRIGALALDIFAAALDPYPRLPDAELEKSESPARDPATSGPFAVLAGLKKKDSSA